MALAGGSAAAASPVPVAAAPTSVPAPALDALIEAAARGDLAPIEQALAEPLPADAAAVLRAAQATARFAPGAADRPLLARFAAGPDGALRRAALSVSVAAAFAESDFATAAHDGRLLEAALRRAGRTEEAEVAGRSWRLAALLSGRRVRRLTRAPAPASIAARRDPAGLTRIALRVNGMAQDAVVDTGAGLTVLSAETARRLGITPLPGAAEVGNSMDGTLPVRVGIAARLEVAGTVLRDVPVLIIADEALSFALPGGRYEIKAILGLPELRLLGRVRIERLGRFAILPPAAAPGPQNMHGNGDELYVDVMLGGRTVALELDTGANQTSLTARYAADNRAAVATLATGQTRSAGAGGARVQQVAAWRDVAVALGGRALRLPAISIALPVEGPPPRLNGTLGQDVLGAFASYTLDFRGMRLELGDPSASESAPASASPASAGPTPSSPARR